MGACVARVGAAEGSIVGSSVGARVGACVAPVGAAVGAGVTPARRACARAQSLRDSRMYLHPVLRTHSRLLDKDACVHPCVCAHARAHVCMLCGPRTLPSTVRGTQYVPSCTLSSRINIGALPFVGAHCARRVHVPSGACIAARQLCAFVHAALQFEKDICAGTKALVSFSNMKVPS